MLKNILVIFFAINAVFWSLFPHNTHCNVATMVVNTCPSHNIHLIIGVISFIIAFVIAQYEHLKSMF